MSLEREAWCPSCEAEHTFWRSASTTLHLGEKTKWVCAECGYSIVRIEDVVDTSDA